jgi:O-antigen/teichoic acid export membrane protein
MSWTLMAQVISVGSMLILPRLVMPSEFGIFSMFSGVAVMLGIVAAGRYEFAIGLPESDGEGAALFTLCAVSCLVIGAISWLVLLMLPMDSGMLQKFAALGAWRGWIAPAAACIGMYNAASYFALRAARFDALGWSKGVVSSATAIGQIGAALVVTRQEGALIVPLLVGQLCGVGMVMLALRDLSPLCRDLPAILKAARRYARFPKLVAPASLFDGIAVLLPIAVISAVYSPAEAGMYALADRTLKVPTTLVGSSVLQVFYERIATLRNDSAGARRLLLRTWRNLALIAIVPTVVLVIWGPPIFGLVFGPTWRDSGAIARLMAAGVFVYFVSYPTSNILVVNERVKSFMLWQATQLLFVAGALTLSTVVRHQSLMSTVAWLVGAQICISLMSLALQWRVVASEPQQVGP